MPATIEMPSNPETWTTLGQLPIPEKIRSFGLTIFRSMPCFRALEERVVGEEGGDVYAEVGMLKYPESAVQEMADWISKTGYVLDATTMDCFPDGLEDYRPNVKLAVDEDRTYIVVDESYTPKTMSKLMGIPQQMARAMLGGGGAPVNSTSVYSWPGGISYYAANRAARKALSTLTAAAFDPEDVAAVADLRDRMMPRIKEVNKDLASLLDQDFVPTIHNNEMAMRLELPDDMEIVVTLVRDGEEIFFDATVSEDGDVVSTFRTLDLDDIMDRVDAIREGADPSEEMDGESGDFDFEMPKEANKDISCLLDRGFRPVYHEGSMAMRHELHDGSEAIVTTYDEDGEEMFELFVDERSEIADDDLDAIIERIEQLNEEYDGGLKY